MHISGDRHHSRAPQEARGSSIRARSIGRLNGSYKPRLFNLSSARVFSASERVRETQWIRRTAKTAAVADNDGDDDACANGR